MEYCDFYDLTEDEEFADEMEVEELQILEELEPEIQDWLRRQDEEFSQFTDESYEGESN